MKIYQRIDSKPAADWWSLHDPHYERKLTNATTLCAYAVSPSTEDVVYTASQYGRAPTLRVYGPDDSSVWHEVPRHPSEELRVYLACLGYELSLQGKLKQG